jgi:hypothetical protein
MMTKFSRRQIGLSVGLIAAGGLISGVVPTEASRQMISFVAAKESFNKLLVEMVANSEKDFGVKYTPEQRTDIENRTWDGVQQVLSAYYVAEETPPELRKLKHTGLLMPTGPR